MAQSKKNEQRRATPARPAPDDPPVRSRRRETIASRVRGRWVDERTRFVASFAIVAATLLTLYYFPRGPDDAVERWTANYLRFYTRAVSLVISVFDPQVSSHGNLIAGRFSIQIVKSCDAMEANILFTAALLAVPAAWRRKTCSLVVGLSALIAFNFLRLFTLYWVGVFAPSTFDFLHLDVWPLAMIMFAALDFVVCVRFMRGRPFDGSGPGALGHVPG